jgi:hypothetical protein
LDYGWPTILDPAAQATFGNARSGLEPINQIGLFQYLEKPWDNNQLLLVIQSGVERRD